LLREKKSEHIPHMAQESSKVMTVKRKTRNVFAAIGSYQTKAPQLAGKFTTGQDKKVEWGIRAKKCGLHCSQSTLAALI
jgi:hypothetical protein